MNYKTIITILIYFGTTLFVGSVFFVYFAYSHYAMATTIENKDLFATVYKGDSKAYRFTVHNAYTYKASDLTGYTLTFYVKKSVTDTTYVVNEACTLMTQSGTTKGQCYVVLSQADTTYVLGNNESDQLSTGTYYAYLVITKTGVKNTLFESKWILTNPS